MVSNSRRIARLFEQQTDVGFRIGFVAILMISITAAFPAFVQIGGTDDHVQNFSNMFTYGLIMTIFFSWTLREMVKRRSKRREMNEMSGGIYLDPMNVYKQTMVVLVGISAGIIMVLVNIYINISGHANVLLASAYGSIDPTAFYLGLLAGVSEELFFRGFLQTMFEIFFGGTMIARLAAPVPAAIIFAWFHYFAYSDPVVFFVLFAIGLILGYLHSFSNDIGIPILAHVINNTFAMLGGVIAAVQGNMLMVVGLAAVAIIAYLLAVGQSSLMKKRKG